MLSNLTGISSFYSTAVSAAQNSVLNITRDASIAISVSTQFDTIRAMITIFNGNLEKIKTLSNDLATAAADGEYEIVFNKQKEIKQIYDTTKTAYEGIESHAPEIQKTIDTHSSQDYKNNKTVELSAIIQKLKDDVKPIIAEMLNYIETTSQTTSKFLPTFTNCKNNPDAGFCATMDDTVLNQVCQNNFGRICRVERDRLSEQTIRNYCSIIDDPTMCACLRRAPSYIPSGYSDVPECWDVGCADAEWQPKFVKDRKKECGNIDISYEAVQNGVLDFIPTDNVNMMAPPKTNDLPKFDANNSNTIDTAEADNPNQPVSNQALIIAFILFIAIILYIIMITINGQSTYGQSIDNTRPIEQSNEANRSVYV